MSLSTVVPYFSAMPESVSPLFTVYVPLSLVSSVSMTCPTDRWLMSEMPFFCASSDTDCPVRSAMSESVSPLFTVYVASASAVPAPSRMPPHTASDVIRVFVFVVI